MDRSPTRSQAAIVKTLGLGCDAPAAVSLLVLWARSSGAFPTRAVSALDQQHSTRPLRQPTDPARSVRSTLMAILCSSRKTARVLRKSATALKRTGANRSSYPCRLNISVPRDLKSWRGSQHRSASRGSVAATVTLPSCCTTLTNRCLAGRAVRWRADFVEAVSVSTSADSKSDILTMVVRRVIDGATVRMIEEQAVVFGIVAGDQPISDAIHFFSGKPVRAGSRHGRRFLFRIWSARRSMRGQKRDSSALLSFLLQAK